MFSNKMHTKRDIIDNFEQRYSDLKLITKDVDEISRNIELSRSKKLSNMKPSKLVIKQGPKGGLYYNTLNGHKVYLSSVQCKQCENETLPNVVSGCAPRVLGKCQPTKAEMKKQISKLEKSEKALKKKIVKLKKDC